MKRVRFARNSKHARWPKGGASSSNPQSQTHRDNKMRRYAEKTEQEERMTESALEKLSAFSFGDDKKSTPMDADFDAKTIDTTFSAFSAASCASFRGIESHWSRAAEDPIAKEICSLASMLTELDAQLESSTTNSPTEVQLDEDGLPVEKPEDPLLRVKQFGTLMVLISNDETQEATLTAAYYLLSMIIGKVNPQILRTQFSDLVPHLRSHLTQYFKSSNALMLKSALTCYAEFLCRQPMKVLLDLKVDAELLMSFVHHDAIKVRKTCFRLINLIFFNSDVITQNVLEKTCQHPFVPVICKNLHECLLDDSKPMMFKMRMLNLLQVMIPHNTSELFKVSLETCLSICSGTDLLLKKKAFSLIEALFKNEDNEMIADSKLNGQLLSALEELKPSFFDEELVSSWFDVFESVLQNLLKLSPHLFSSHLVSFLSYGVTTVFASQIKPTINHYARVLNGFFDNLTEDVRKFWLESSHDKLSDISKIAEIVAELTNFKYSDNFLTIFTFIGKVYTAAGPEFYGVFENSVVNLCTLRTNDSEIFGLQIVLKKAVSSFGPEKILESYPLNIKGEANEDLLRSWIIPLFQTAIVKSQLLIWQQKFYPIVKNAETNMEGMYKQPSQLKTLQILRSQIWNLLPAFCLNCTDAKESFTPGFAKHLSSLIAENHACSSSILDAIMAMLKSTQPEPVTEIMKYSKNFMPQFFNLYLDEKTPIHKRRKILRILDLFLGKISKEQLKSYFENAEKRVLSAETSLQTKKLLVDLIREMTPVLETEQLNKMFTSLLPELLKQDELNKKVVLILKKYLNFVSSDELREKSTDSVTLLKNFMPNLLQVFDNGSNSARKQALKSLLLFVDQKALDLTYLNDILPRAVISLKVERGHVKEVAVKLFKACCNRFVDESKMTKGEAVERLTKVLMDGVESKCTDKTIATMTSLQYLVALYSEVMGIDLYKKFFLFISEYLKNATRPMFFEPALHLLKVIISVLDSSTIYQFCERIVQELYEWNRMTLLKYRFSVKVVLFRLAKKVGADVIHNMCPESLKKLASSIRKQINKEELKRKMNEGRISDDQSQFTIDDDATSAYTRVTKAETIADILKELESSDDEAETKTSMVSRKTSKSNRSVFINEAKDGIVDLAEKNSSKYLTSKALTKNEVSKESKTKKSELKFAPDGRLLLIGDDGKVLKPKEKTKLPGIHDDSDEDMDPKELKGRQVGIKSDSSDTDDDEGVSAKKKRKKAMSVASSNHSWRSFKSKSSRSKKSNIPYETGKTFKAKKAGGDVSVRGKPQPYAFVPLDAQVLNKRKAKKVEGRLKGLVKSSKKGAGKGLKSRTKIKKR
ncbi:RRP12-like protein [Convolutriloba macropyga]|uniref:RRP12-like protein n=1 Tax=Convolutriloba macropyga TaxID=536237 RepID=UPI003F5270AA